MFHINGDTVVKGLPESVITAVRDCRVKGHALYIDTKRVNFEDGPVLEGLSLRSGGEWPNRRPVWQDVSPDGNHRKQIWPFKNNDRLAVTDQSGGIRICVLAGGQFRLTSPKLRIVAEYIYQRGLLQRSVRGVDWAINQLKLMQQSCPSLIDMNWLDELNRKRATLG